MLAAIAGSVVSSAAMAGGVVSPYLTPEQRAAHEARLAELEAELFGNPNLVSRYGQPANQTSFVGHFRRFNQGETFITPTLRPIWSRNNYEIYWSYIPDGQTIETSPASGFGQGECPPETDPCHSGPEAPGDADAFSSRLFNAGLSTNIDQFGGPNGGQRAWQTIVKEQFDKWEEISAIDFVFVAGGGPTAPNVDDDDVAIDDNPNVDDASGWDVAAYGFPDEDADFGRGDIRIAATTIDGPVRVDGTGGEFLTYVYPTNVNTPMTLPPQTPDPENPNADPIQNPDQIPMMGQPDTRDTNFGYASNIIIDADEAWTDPAYPNLFDIAMLRSIAYAIGLVPSCAADPLDPFSVLEHQPQGFFPEGVNPLPQLFLTDLQEDDIRAVQNLYGDPFEPNDDVVSAQDIPFTAPPVGVDFVFAPHLLLPFTAFDDQDPNDVDPPVPLSISNNNVQNGFTVDVDRFRLIVPVTDTGSFLMDVQIDPAGTPFQEYPFIENSSPARAAGPGARFIGVCDRTGDPIDRDPATVQDLSFSIRQFDPFSNEFTTVAEIDETEAGFGETIIDFPVTDGVYYIDIEGDGGTRVQLYNLTVTLSRPEVANAGLNVEPILQTLGGQAFADIGVDGTGTGYAVIDGPLASSQHDALSGRPRRTVSWPGVNPAVTSVSAHPTSVAALAIGGPVGDNFSGVSTGADFYSSSIATQVFADGSFALGKTATYFGIFGLVEPTLVRGLQLGEPATVINAAFSAGGQNVTGDDSITQAFDAAVTMYGVTVVAAAGNNGQADLLCRGVDTFAETDPGGRFFGSRTIVSPATAFNVISVGAAGSSDGTAFDIVANFSAKGPVDANPFTGAGAVQTDVRSGVDIVAPGTGFTPIPPEFMPGDCNYLGPQPLSSLQVPSLDPDDDPENISDTGFLAPGQGTSLASSFVAGAVSLLQDRGLEQNTAINPLVMKAVLLSGAVKLEGWTNLGGAPAQPQDNRDGADIDDGPITALLNVTNPLDNGQGAGLLDLKRSLEIYSTGYDPSDPVAGAFPGPTIDPPETDPDRPSLRVPPDDVAGGEPQDPMPAPGGGNAPDTNPRSTSLTTLASEDVVSSEPQRSPIEIARLLREAVGSDREVLYGTPLQLGGEKDPDLKGGRGETAPAFATGPISPFIQPSLGGGAGPGGDGGGGSGGPPDIPGAAEGGAVAREIEPLIVDPIGWDYGNLDQSNFSDGGGGNIQTGFIDYIINIPLETLRPDPLSPGNFIDPDVLTVSLVWLREILVEDQNFLSSTDPRIGTFSALELENLELEIFLADGLGNPISSLPIASSVGQFSTVEHLSFEIPQAGTYLMRVRWNNNEYDVFGNRAIAEQRYAIAWRVDFSPRSTLAAAPSDFGTLVEILGSWGGQLGDRSNPYNAEADVNRDGAIDFADIRAVLASWNR